MFIQANQIYVVFIIIIILSLNMGTEKINK